MSPRRAYGLPSWAPGLLALLLALPFALPLSGVLLPAGVAHADDPEPEVSDENPEEAAATPPDVWDRILSVEAHLGVDTPYGIFGAGLEIAPIRYVAIFVGGGIAREGGRFGGGLRLRFPLGNGTIGLQVGASGGPMIWQGPQGAELTWGMTAFLHAAFYAEIRTEMGVYFRLYVGGETTLTSADTCIGSGGGTCDPEATHAATRPFVGLAGGYAFDL